MYISVACRYMGLGSEWNDRWCVVMPRFPSVAAPANQQLTRSLLVIYKVCIHMHFACLQCLPSSACLPWSTCEAKVICLHAYTLSASPANVRGLIV